MSTQILSEFVEGLEFNQIPQKVIIAAKSLVLDTLGCIVSGTTEQPTKIISSTIRQFEDRNKAIVIGEDFKTSCLNAVLIHGASAHSQEFDDLYRPCTIHPGTVIIPSVLSLGEHITANGKELLTSIVAGYEVMIRVGHALGKTHYQYWHTTATAGVLGASASCSKLLHLSSEKTLDAFGNAGTQASGLWEFNIDGAMSKVLHTGRAAQNGLLSTLLAKNGFTGAKRILEGERGLLRAASKDYNIKKLQLGLKEDYQLIKTSIKQYPTCGHTHSSIEAIFNLVDKYGLRPSDIKQIIVNTYSTAIDVAGTVKPKTPAQAKFSIKYCVAAALKDREITLEQFKTCKLNDPELSQLMNKIEVQADPTLNHAYPIKWPAIVVVETVNGNQWKEEVDHPRDILNDKKEMIQNKFILLASKVIGRNNAREIVNKVFSLEKMRDISNLLSLCVRKN
ncbi:MAG: MmgE/PrpD family protein [Candidatus Hodarchaeota archaeon]